MIEIIFWSIALVSLLVVEGVTTQLVTIWFAFGALVSLIFATFKLSVFIQVAAFVVVSLITLLITRPLVKRMNRKSSHALNADRCIGKTAIVTEKIDNINSTGAAKVDGLIWTARSSDDSIIEQGQIVKIEKIEGVKIIVKKEN